MKSRLPLFFVACGILSTAPLSLTATPAPQSLAAPGVEPDQGTQRVFHYQKAEVEKAIQDLHATFSGRLPTLNGFAQISDEQRDRFTRGYYECSVKVQEEGQDEAQVKVSAKITAWYADAAPAKSGYRELPSNGHVEEDLLDRIEEALASRGQARSGAQPTGEKSIAEAPMGRPRLDGERSAPHPYPHPYIDTSNLARGNTRLEQNLRSSVALASPAGSASAGTGSIEDIESLRRRREEAERQLSEMSAEVKNLEEILRNQSHPADLAVVRKSGTRVMPQPSANGAALFSAESEDEFQILDTGPDWVRVQISGASRGWVRRSEVTLPAGPKQISGAAQPSAGQESDFQILREETSLFKGKWEPLSGKNVTIIWAAPASTSVKAATGAARKRFAKTIFARAYQELSSRESTAQGVVLVLDSADGGQIAATSESLQQWQTGIISEVYFWKNCSVDPPDFFDP